jgi:hypothetical protein
MEILDWFVEVGLKRSLVDSWCVTVSCRVKQHFYEEVLENSTAHSFLVHNNKVVGGFGCTHVTNYVRLTPE